MCITKVILVLLVAYGTRGKEKDAKPVEGDESYYDDNIALVKVIFGALQDKNFYNEVVFDLKMENQVYQNRTLSSLIKYIVKREVDNYRHRRPDAIARRVFSALVMKLLDISRDMPSELTASERVAKAHMVYMGVETRDMHDEIADRQMFHACARLYDILVTAPKIISALGKIDYLTPGFLLRKLQAIQVKPIHLAILLLIQYNLRLTTNFMIKEQVLEILTTQFDNVGPQVVKTIQELSTRLLPVLELIDTHLAHSSPMFKNECPASWLGIVNDQYQGYKAE